MTTDYFTDETDDDQAYVEDYCARVDRQLEQMHEAELIAISEGYEYEENDAYDPSFYREEDENV